MVKKRITINAPHTSAGFKGYTMDELRYQRALIALKREYSKESIQESLAKVRKDSPFSEHGKRNLAGNIGGVAGKIIGGLNYFDYILLGFSAFGTIRKVLHFFHRKK